MRDKWNYTTNNRKLENTENALKKQSENMQNKQKTRERETTRDNI